MPDDICKWIHLVNWLAQEFYTNTNICVQTINSYSENDRSFDSYFIEMCVYDISSCAARKCMFSLTEVLASLRNGDFTSRAKFFFSWRVGSSVDSTLIDQSSGLISHLGGIGKLTMSSLLFLVLTFWLRHQFCSLVLTLNSTAVWSFGFARMPVDLFIYISTIPTSYICIHQSSHKCMCTFIYLIIYLFFLSFFSHNLIILTPNWTRTRYEYHVK